MKKIFPWLRLMALGASAIMVMVAVTFSWFTGKERAKMDEVQSNAVEQADNDSKIAYITSTEWFSSIDIPNTESLRFKPITGDGQNFFQQKYVLKELPGSMYSAMVPDGYEPVVSGSQDYLSLDFKIRNNYNTSLYLDKGSYVRPASLEGGGINEVADYAAGAVRVCVSQKIDGVYQPLFVWVPNTTYEVTGSLKDGYSATTTGVVEEGYTFRSGETDSSLFTLYPTDNNIAGGEKMQAGMQRVDEVLYFWGDIAEIPGISSVVIGTCEKGKEEEYRLTIWLDGSDRECTNAVIGGSIMARLQFNTAIIDTN